MRYYHDPKRRHYFIQLSSAIQFEKQDYPKLLAPSPRVRVRFLKEYQSACLVRAAKPKAIANALKRQYVGNKLKFTAEDIVKVAQNSVETVSPAKEIIVRGKICAQLHLQETLAEVTKVLTDLRKSTEPEDSEILRPIKGVGPNTAAPFLSEMGEVKNYPSHKKLIAYAGIDPSVHQSGIFIGVGNVSKKRLSGLSTCREPKHFL